jgi:nitrogen fixation NifU-like protein
MSTELQELYQEIILDHSRRPRNFGELENAAVRVHGDNPACGDEIHLSVQFAPVGSLQEIRFTGHGCAISQASASLMTTKMKGRTPDEAKALVRAFYELVTGQSDHHSESLGDLRIMGGVRSFPQRVKCAMLAWRALEQALRQSAGESTISTETDLPA